MTTTPSDLFVAVNMGYELLKLLDPPQPRSEQKMPFNLSFPAQNGIMDQLKIEAGQMLFVLGANGTGKSSLMTRFAQQNYPNCIKIAAHRQTWMNSDTQDMTSTQKVAIEQNIRNQDQSIDSRYRDHHASQRTSMTIYEIINSQNMRARSIADAFDAGNLEKANEAAKDEAPIKSINEMLSQSNIPIQISIGQNDRLIASKNGGAEYSASELSDGERNALLIAGSVLTAPFGTLLIIDEPERHLHRSIIAPLLIQLFNRRSDCAFIVATHDYELPLGITDARILLIRSATYNGQQVLGWEVDELHSNAPIADIIKRDLLGARRQILFVEGDESSLDKPLYSIIFPMVSVISKGSCRSVEQAVIGARAGNAFHWLRAFGIVDGDGYSDDQILTKELDGIFALPYYSVEAIYYHPYLIRKIAEKQSAVLGVNDVELFKAAEAAGFGQVAKDTARLARNVVRKASLKAILDQVPNEDEILKGGEVKIHNYASQIQAEKIAILDTAITESNWEIVLKYCPLKDSGAPSAIANALKFQKLSDYQKAAKHLLSNDINSLEFVRGLFGNLFNELNR